MSTDADAGTLVEGLIDLGIGLVSSVPCSYFRNVLALLESEACPALRHVPAVNEGSAVAVAAGSWLGGVPAAVLAQNSGFGNMVNPLTSLLLPYEIPVLVFLSMRGWPAAEAGEPQHAWMGRVVPDWLRSVAVPYWLLTSDGPSLADVLNSVRPVLAARRAAFVLVGQDAMSPRAKGSAVTTSATSGSLLTRGEVVAAVVAEAAEDAILTTTGYLSRELFNQADRPENFYMQGSMGHIAGIALGAALAQPDRRFVVLDGDGAFLMHLGTGATIGHFSPPNLRHVVFDNAGYESTGGQPTAAAATDMPLLARALGYKYVATAEVPESIRPAIRALLEATGPAILLVHGMPSAAPSGRASEVIATAGIATRFARALAARER